MISYCVLEDNRSHSSSSAVIVRFFGHFALFPIKPCFYILHQKTFGKTKADWWSSKTRRLAPFLSAVTSTLQNKRMLLSCVVGTFYSEEYRNQSVFAVSPTITPLGNSGWGGGGICFHLMVLVGGLCICMSTFINWESGSCHVTICTSFSFRENAAFCCPTGSAACWPEQQCTGKTLLCGVISCDSGGPLDRV